MANESIMFNTITCYRLGMKFLIVLVRFQSNACTILLEQVRFTSFFKVDGCRTPPAILWRQLAAQVCGRRAPFINLLRTTGQWFCSRG